MTARPETTRDYLAALSEEKRAALERIRQVIKSTARRAEECLSYGLPAFRLDGKPLVAFGATAKHCALYLMGGSTVAAHKDELEAFDTSKGMIRFPPGNPPPTALVRKLVKARITHDKMGRKYKVTRMKPKPKKS